MWINFVLWEGRGRRKRECSFRGSPGRRGSFVGKLVLIAAAFVLTFSFLFSLVAYCGTRGWWHSNLAPFRLGSEVWGPFPPLLWKNRFLDHSTLLLGKEGWLHMTSKTLFLFFQTKIVAEDASSQLSQSTGIYSSGHLISIWRSWAGYERAESRRGVKRMVVCRSLFPNM